MENKADDRQVGGRHYKSEYEHWNWVIDCGLGNGYFVAAISKYLKRWRDKNGPEDLEKAAHYLDKMIEVAPILAYQRSPLPAVAIENYTNAYIKANGIKGYEAMICHLLVTWQMPSQLVIARAYLEDILEKSRADDVEQMSKHWDDESIHAKE